MSLFVTLTFIILPFLYFYRKYGVVGLLLCTVPYERVYFPVGISLKPFTLVLIATIIGLLLRKHYRLHFISVLLQDNRSYFIYFLLFITLISTMLSSPSISVITQILSFIFCIFLIFVFYVYVRLRGLEYVMIALKNVSMFYAVVTVSLYILNFLYPSILNYGSHFFIQGNESIFKVVIFDLREGVDYLPHLYGFNTSPAIHALFLLPAFVGFFLDLFSHRKVIDALKFGVIAISIGLSFNKTAIITCVVLAVLALNISGGRTRLRRYSLAVSSLLGVFILFPYAIDAYHFLSEMKGNPHSRSNLFDLNNLTANRYTYWIYGLSLFKENVLFGIGLGNYINESKQLWEGMKDLHSTYLMILVELGLISFVAYMAFYFSLFIQLLSKVIFHRERLDAFYAHVIVLLSLVGILMFYTMQMIYFTPIVYILLGMSMSLTGQDRLRRLVGRQQPNQVRSV